VQEALLTLKPKDQRLMRLRYSEDMSTEDVAVVMGMTASAVKTRLHRARQVLKDAVEQDARCA
jgi:RNA polymerase sigma-70 factor (ECF subfamily)